MNLDIDADRPVRLMVLETPGDVREVEARVVSVSDAGRSMVLETGLHPAPNARVKLICPPYMMLGEISSTNEVDGTVAVRIRHVLKQDDIERIRANWF